MLYEVITVAHSPLQLPGIVVISEVLSPLHPPGDTPVEDSIAEKQALAEQLDAIQQETATLRGESEQTLLQCKQQSDLIEQLTADRQAADEALRITSYNVCYTKLLRTESAGGLPEWDDLSLDFRSGFSMPHMDVHVYDTDPSRRFVLVNLQKFREGDRLPNGAVIEKILPDGMQLSYQGTRFHYAK